MNEIPLDINPCPECKELYYHLETCSMFEHSSPLPLVPEKCLICNAPWKGGSERPGNRFPKVGVRVFYYCGSSLSIIDRPESGVYDGYCYHLRLKNCNSKEGIYLEG